MSLSTTDSRFVYDGDGTTTEFSFPRKIIEAAHLDVWLYDEDDDSYALQTLNTHYTFAGSGLSNGIYASATITFTTAPGSDKKVVLYRDPSLVQEADFSGETNVLNALNRFADRVTMQMQRMQDQIDRTIKLPDGDYAPSWGNTGTKADYANALLGFDSSGAPMPSGGSSGDVAISPAMAPVVQGSLQNAADTLEFAPSGATAAMADRSLSERAVENINVRDFGALGDGSGDTVAEWLIGGDHARGYASLGAIQADYPDVGALTDTIDGAAFQAAARYAKTVVRTISASAIVIVKASVRVPAGDYVLNTRTEIESGVRVIGAGKANTSITWTGVGSGPFAIKGDSGGGAAHFGTSIEHIFLYNQGSGTTYGVECVDSDLHAIRSCSINECGIQAFTENIRADNSWTLLVGNSLIRLGNYNIRCKNATSVLIFNNRIDDADEDNILIENYSGSLYTASLAIKDNEIQRADKWGVHIIGAESADIHENFFEGNGTDGSSYGHVYCEDDADARGRWFSVTGGHFTAPGTTGGVGVKIDRAVGVVISADFRSGNLGTAVSLGSNVEEAWITSPFEPAITNKISTASSSTLVHTGRGCVYDEFTGSGTWTKRLGAVAVVVEAVGGGGGGGGGGKAASATGVSGGGGGGGGGRFVARFKASSLASTVSVTVGAAGTSGAGATVDGAGSDGGAGGNSSFGSHGTAFGGGFGSGGNASVLSGGGGGGSTRAAGGNASGATAGTNGSAISSGAGGAGAAGGNSVTETGGGGGGGGHNNANGGAGGCAFHASGGGGAGGGKTAADAITNGGSALRAGTTSSIAGGSSDGAAGTAGASELSRGGTGGGGGAGSVAGNGGAGGAGGAYGGGGGGGGASQGGSGGAGGAGGAGIVRVWTFF